MLIIGLSVEAQYNTRSMKAMELLHLLKTVSHYCLQ